MKDKEKSKKLKKKLNFNKKNLILSFKTIKRKGLKVISESECLKTYFVGIILFLQVEKV
jgi:ribosomal protein S8